MRRRLIVQAFAGLALLGCADRGDGRQSDAELLHAFPEYTSGHSVISNAAAAVLTDQFGDKRVASAAGTENAAPKPLSSSGRGY